MRYSTLVDVQSEEKIDMLYVDNIAMSTAVALRLQCIYDYVNADYDDIVSHLLNDSFLSYPMCDQDETADQVWEKFIKPLNKALQHFVPTKPVLGSSPKKIKRRPRHIRRALNKKASSLETVSQQ